MVDQMLTVDPTGPLDLYDHRFDGVLPGEGEDDPGVSATTCGGGLSNEAQQSVRAKLKEVEAKLVELAGERQAVLEAEQRAVRNRQATENGSTSGT